MLVVTLESTLVSRRGYPNTYREFLKMFPDNAACAAYLVRLRWPEGFTCPACKSTSIAWNESRNRLECSICHHQTYLTAGTIFDKTLTPPNYLV
jgi:Zn ribbon nucleic-acid-binding protein